MHDTRPVDRLSTHGVESPAQGSATTTAGRERIVPPTTLALITPWVVGAQAYPVIREGIDAAMGNLTDEQQQAFTDALPTTP